MSSNSGRQAAEDVPATPPHPDDPDAAFGGIAWADEAEDGATGGDGRAGEAPGAPGSGRDADGGAAAEEVGVDGPRPPADAEAAPDISVEDLVLDLERVSGERDQYLDASRRLQAEFENYKKAVAKREVEARERANESLVSEILPVLDACDGALASGASDVEPVRTALIDALTKQGLDRIDGADEAFDPALHDAVMHEPSEDGDGPVVAEVMRAGYRWKGRVVRPAMVRVRG
ncbi:MAG: nucleotide exchange factor GrpE [Actinomycetota bacterium]